MRPSASHRTSSHSCSRNVASPLLAGPHPPSRRPPRELEDMRRQGRIGPAAPGNDPWVIPQAVPEIVPEDVSQVPQAAHQVVAQSTSKDPSEQDVPPLDPSIRIIIEYSDAISIDVASLGSTDSDSSRQPCVELDAAQSSSFRELAVVQYKKDLGVTIKASTAAKAGLALHCRLSFDPAADRIVIANRYIKSVVAKPLDRGSPAQPRTPIELKPYFVEMLESGSWAICTSSGHQLLDLSILPRRNIALSRTPDQAIGLAVSGIKRPYEASQPTTGEARKVQPREDENPDQANIIFQPAPEAVDAAQAEPHLPPAPGQWEAVLGLRHPFEDLRAGDIAKIIGPDGEGYTLSYDKTVSLRSNSHVFTAKSSDIPDKLMVVKVVRSPSGLVAQGESRRVAERVQRMGELWLKEVKIHAQLSRHVSPSPVTSDPRPRQPGGIPNNHTPALGCTPLRPRLTVPRVVHGEHRRAGAGPVPVLQYDRYRPGPGATRYVHGPLLHPPAGLRTQRYQARQHSLFPKPRRRAYRLWPVVRVNRSDLSR